MAISHVSHLIRDPSNNHIFANPTSGFHLLEQFLIEILEATIKFLSNKKIQMIEYPDFQSGCFEKKDIIFI